MNKKFIPIIGTISAGKSTFLQGLLGTNVFETGSITTTKFVCLIKNSEKTQFYHVIPERKENFISFKKVGLEFTGEEKIKAKIKDINKNLSEKKEVTKDDIFYILEMPIKNIDNQQLLDDCYFMDIPGLNENKSSYIDIIFSLLTLDDIAFEIIIFDSTSIGSDNILNKIDQIKLIREEEVIDNFKQYFYHNFEDDKNENLIPIDISKNKFIPMNSLLFLAETKMNEDFCSMLKVELFSYLEAKNKGQLSSSFYEYLKEKIKFIFDSLGKLNMLIDFNNNAINKDDYNIIKNSIEEIINMKKNLGIEFTLGIKLENLEKQSIKTNFEKLYLIHKNKLNFCVDIKYSYKIKQIMKNMKKLNDRNKSFNYQIEHNNNPINIYFDEDDENKNNKFDSSLLDNLENFLNSTFKRLDLNKELGDFIIALQNIRESIIGRKIRIAFIGNINVGKSTVLNAIIGKEILPINDEECTYRGIIIRHVEKEKENFKLYKTSLISKGKGNNEYYYFEDENKPYREGVEEIKNFLKIKNNDKNMKDTDAYFVITGKLKIFDFIKLDNNIISKIEFIDLPGVDRKDNTFNKKKYYEKILKFSNCCVYINEPKTIDDENSLMMMQNQYISDKMKVSPKLRDNFIKTCLFLINKSDLLEEQEKRLQIRNNIINHISEIENQVRGEDIIISFFSGKKFSKYLNVINNYIYVLENEPKILLSKLYEEYKNKKLIFYHTFKSFIYEKLDEIEEDFPFVISENQIENINVTKKIKNEIEDWEKNCIKYKLFENGDYDEVSKRLYEINNHLKKMRKDDLEKDNYSSKFFDELKNAIENSEKIGKKNFKENLENFFQFTDDLFAKEVKGKKSNKIIEKRKEILEKYDFQKKILQKFNETEENVKNIFGNTWFQIFGIINEEKSDISKKLEESNKDVKLASEKLKDKINNIIREMADKLNVRIFILKEEIKKEVESISKNFAIQFAKDIETNIGLNKKMVLSFLTSTGLTIFGETILADTITTTLGSAVGGAVAGPIGIGIGVGVGIAISITNLIIHYFRKEKRYKKGIKEYKEKIENDFNECRNNYLEDLKSFKEDFISKLSLKLSLLQVEIGNIDVDDWKEIRDKYRRQKEELMNKLSQLNN